MGYPHAAPNEKDGAGSATHRSRSNGEREADAAKLARTSSACWEASGPSLPVQSGRRSSEGDGHMHYAAAWPSSVSRCRLMTSPSGELKRTGRRAIRTLAVTPR